MNGARTRMKRREAPRNPGRAAPDFAIAPSGLQMLLRLTHRFVGNIYRTMPKRITVRLPADLLNRARRKAAAEGRTLASLIEHGLRFVMAGNKRAAKGERIMPRISVASGGLMPGIDLNDSAALQETEDLDAIDRMKPVR